MGLELMLFEMQMSEHVMMTTHRWMQTTGVTEAHLHWSGGETVKTVLYVVNERARKARRLGESGGMPPQEIFEFQAL